MSEVDATGDAEVVRQALAGRDVACVLCGYNLRDAARGVCPECGWNIEMSELVFNRWMPPGVLHVASLVGLAGWSVILPLCVVMMMQSQFWVLPLALGLIWIGVGGLLVVWLRRPWLMASRPRGIRCLMWIMLAPVAILVVLTPFVFLIVLIRAWF